MNINTNLILNKVSYTHPQNTLSELHNNPHTLLLLNIKHYTTITSNKDMSYKSKLYYTYINKIINYFHTYLQHCDTYIAITTTNIWIKNISKNNILLPINLLNIISLIYQYIHKPKQYDPRFHEYNLYAYTMKHIDKQIINTLLFFKKHEFLTSDSNIITRLAYE